MRQIVPDMINGLILFILSLLFGFLVFTALIWSFAKWSNKKSRNTGCLIAIIFFFISVACGGFLIYKGVGTFVENIPKIEAKRLEIVAETMTCRHHSSALLDSIKSIQPKDKKIPETFYTYAGLRDYYRMPLVYPYSIHAIDDLEQGFIDNEEGIKNIAKDANKSKHVMHSITAFSFDKGILIAKTEFFDKEIKYKVLQFNNGEISTFDHEKEMKNKAYSLGFDTLKPMMSVKEYYNKF